MTQEYIKNPDLLNYTLGEDYIRDEKLNELVKGKTIAMVGPAPNLQGSAMGEFIDSHDLIFRVGDSPVGFLGQNDRCVDYGSRSDVLVHSFNDHDRPQLQQDIQWLRSLKYLLQPMVRSYETPRQLEWFKMIDVPVHHVPDHHMKSGLNESQKLHNPNHYIQHFRDILKIEKHRDKIKLDTFLTENFDKSNSNE